MNKFIVSEKPKKTKLLILGADSDDLKALRRIKNLHNYSCNYFTDHEKALKSLQTKGYELFIFLSDIKKKKLNKVLNEISQIDPTLSVIIIQKKELSESDINDSDIESIETLVSPVEPSAMGIIIKQAIKTNNYSKHNIKLRENMSIYELINTLSASTDLNDILQKLAETLKTQFNIEEISIMIPTENKNELYIAYVTGNKRDHLLHKRFPVENTISGWVAKNKKSLLLHGKVSDKRFKSLIENSGIVSSISVPVVLEEQLLAVVNINVKKERKPLSEGEIKTLFFILNITAPVIKNANSYTSLHSELKYNVKRLKRIIDETTVALSSALELKDPYTAGHQKRVSKLASDIAKKMGLPDNVVESVCVAGMLHDIGKIYVPSEILSKPSKLSHPETSIIRTHPEVGYEILNSIEFPWAIADIVYQSHERLNGSGYPRGLKGDEILLESRILAVADVVEAMSSHRPYRASLGLDSAIAEIKKGAGVLYDSEVVKACLKLYNEKSFKFI